MFDKCLLSKFTQLCNLIMEASCVPVIVYNNCKSWKKKIIERTREFINYAAFEDVAVRIENFNSVEKKVRAY